MYKGKLTENLIKWLNTYEEKFGEMYALLDVDLESDADVIEDIKRCIDMNVSKSYPNPVGEI